VIRDQDKFHESGLAAQTDNIRNAIKRFDDATLAAAYSIRDAEMRLGEATLTQADAEAIWAAACAVNPHAPGIITMLSNLESLPVQMQTALPELVNDTNIARIAAALGFIDNELNNYFADSDTGHLTNALDTGLQRLHQALRRSFGYWQMGHDPGRWGPVVADVDLRPERRDKLTGKLLAALQGWIPGSVAQLRGSLGAGTADDYSDIDICWVVPDRDFTEAADTLGAALSQCTAVLALRTDPEFARSARRRVVFARLHGMPLFWRVDIDIRANSVAADDPHDASNPDARNEAGCSAPASAIENAIAAIKAAARGQADVADGLLGRGFKRIGHDPGPTVDLADAITSLADACAAQEPSLTRTAAEVREVADHILRSARLGDN
jgi:hypothetical protein